VPHGLAAVRATARRKADARATASPAHYSPYSPQPPARQPPQRSLRGHALGVPLTRPAFAWPHARARRLARLLVLHQRADRRRKWPTDMHDQRAAAAVVAPASGLAAKRARRAGQAAVWAHRASCTRGLSAAESARAVFSFAALVAAESREIELLRRLKPLFNVCARLMKSRPAPLSQANLDAGAG
jgi:hypothetical protein